jgi:hypothetical protein
MARNTGRWFGQLAALAAVVTVVLSGLVAVATPAAAATAPPWHWTNVTGSATLTWFSSQTVSLGCPGGYIPMSGGFTAIDGELRLKGEHADFGTNSFVFTIGNATGATHSASLDVWCANANEVGTITLAHTTVSKSTSGRAGSFVNCPTNMYAVGGDAEWSSTGSRTLDFAGPDQLGVSWAASGSSAATVDTLTITARCAPITSGVWPVVVMQSVSGTTTLTATCPSGRRVVSGGSYVRVTGQLAIDSTDRGYAVVSTSTRTSWTSTISSTGSGDFAVSAICIPTNVPAVSWTSVPSTTSNSASGQIVFAASDPLGQSVSVSCALDGAAKACSSGTSFSYGALSEGPHQFSVDAVNQDGEHTVANYNWRIDLTPPTVVSMDPGSDAPLDAAFVAIFSEQMQGVSAATFQVLAEGDAQPLAGDVATSTIFTNCPSGCTKATFTPASPLLGHHAYTATLTAGNHDVAGNSLPTTSWQVTTADRAPSCTDVAAGTTAVNTDASIPLTCSDPDGDALSYSVVSPPSHGHVGAPDGAGTVSYTPDAGYVGSDTFTYTVDDGNGGTAPAATVTISVGPNHAPSCDALAVQVGYQSSSVVSLSCGDVDNGQSLTYAIDTAPTHGGLGALSGNGKVTYAPDPGFTGDDTFTYHATDGYGSASPTQTVTLSVAPNSAPTCASKTMSVAHATALSIPLSCTDADAGQTLTLSVVTSASHGSLSMTDATHVTYKPAASFGGTDSFTYRATDGQGGESAPATVTLRVAPGATVLTLRAATLTLAGGKTDRLTCRLRDKVTGAYVNGRTVLLQFRRSTATSWTTVAKTVTARVGTTSGVARFSVSPRHSCYYRLVFRGSSAYRSSTSAAIHIRVT